MIAIARRNLSSLFSNPNSFLCNSIVDFFPPIHFFSTSRVVKLSPRPEIYDVLVHKHHFSPQLASLISSRLPKCRSPQKVHSIISCLKENSFTTAQLEKILLHYPRVLGLTVENIKFKFKVLQDLGLSSEEVAKIISINQSILHISTESKIIPRISVLKALLGSHHDVAKLLRKSAWFLKSDLAKTLMPNVEILKSCGVPIKAIGHFLYIRPRCFLVKSYVLRKSAERATECGLPHTSVTFIQAADVFTFTSEGMWEVKLQILRDLGFSDDDIFTMFRKQPSVFAAGEKKMKNVVELLLATGKYDISSIVAFPVALGCSIEKRIEPRMQILRLLESRDLIQKWPPLSSALTLTDDKFIDRFVRPYYDEIGEEHITNAYVEGRKRR